MTRKPTLSKAQTVNDLLATDDVNETIQELIDSKPDMRNLVAVWVDGKGTLNYIVPDIPKSQVIGYLEIAKICIIMEGDEHD